MLNFLDYYFFNLSDLLVNEKWFVIKEVILSIMEVNVFSKIILSRYNFFWFNRLY